MATETLLESRRKANRPYFVVSRPRVTTNFPDLPLAEMDRASIRTLKKHGLKDMIKGGTADILWEDNDGAIVTFMPQNPYTRYHAVVGYFSGGSTHPETIDDLSSTASPRLFQAIESVSRAVYETAKRKGEQLSGIFVHQHIAKNERVGEMPFAPSYHQLHFHVEGQPPVDMIQPKPIRQTNYWLTRNVFWDPTLPLASDMLASHSIPHTVNPELSSITIGSRPMTFFIPEHDRQLARGLMKMWKARWSFIAHALTDFSASGRSKRYAPRNREDRMRYMSLIQELYEWSPQSRRVLDWLAENLHDARQTETGIPRAGTLAKGIQGSWGWSHNLEESGRGITRFEWAPRSFVTAEKSGVRGQILRVVSVKGSVVKDNFAERVKRRHRDVIGLAAQFMRNAVAETPVESLPQPNSVHQLRGIPATA